MGEYFEQILFVQRKVRMREKAQEEIMVRALNTLPSKIVTVFSG